MEPAFASLQARKFMKALFLSVAPLVALWALPTVSVFAQPGSTGPAPGTAAIETPLDGGASLLLAGGVAYGFRKLRARRQANREER